MSQQSEAELYRLFDKLKQTEIEDYDQETYAGIATNTARLEWLKDLSRELQDAVDTKARTIAELESELDDLRAVETALEQSTHRVKLSLGIATVEGQLPLTPTDPSTTEPGV